MYGELKTDSKLLLQPRVEAFWAIRAMVWASASKMTILPSQRCKRLNVSYEMPRRPIKRLFLAPMINSGICRHHLALDRRMEVELCLAKCQSGGEPHHVYHSQGAGSVPKLARRRRE